MRTYAIASLLILFTALMSCGNTKSTMPAENLVGKTWQLSSINGKAVNAPASGRELPYITFTTDNKAMGNSGCNNFSGSYNLNDEGGLNISQVMATKMFCEGVDEGGFFDALDKVTMSKVEKDKLTLMDGTAEVLVFVSKQ
jgi:heat shock protein HslJ